MANFPTELRKEIYAQYWEKSDIQKREFLCQRVSEYEKKSKLGEGTKNRQKSRQYTLKSGGLAVPVCQSFFLKTLGYQRSHVVDYIFSQQHGLVKKDMRGSHTPSHKLSLDKEKSVIDHINSFHPAISHYRRKHAPLRLYLPPELDITKLYKDYKEKFLVQPVSYSTYRKYLRKMNISFTKLGEEECEECEEFKLHECPLKPAENPVGNITAGIILQYCIFVL